MPRFGLSAYADLTSGGASSPLSGAAGAATTGTSFVPSDPKPTAFHETR